MIFSLLLAHSVVRATSSVPETLSLDGAWKLTQTERKIDIPARVPGVVQTDLLRAKLIPDPYFGTNEKEVQWVSDLPWKYSRSFSVTPEFMGRRKIVVRCEGIDTFSTIYVNGQEVGKSNNMYRTFEFDAKPFLKAGENTITIDFQTLAAFLKSNVGRPALFGKPVQEGGKPYIRKPAFQGGWDFSPKLLTMGIWRNISLLGWNAARLTNVAVVQDHTKKGEVRLNVKLAADTDGQTHAHVTINYKGHRVAEADARLAEGAGNCWLTIRHPHLWWPNEMGLQSMYDVKVDLRSPTGEVVDQGSRRIGLRTVTWIPKTDTTQLGLVVNGRHFFAKGSNWVPFDSLLRENPDKERALVQKAVDAHFNLLRIWGGGYYQNDAFFDTCDEKGVMTWFEFGYADSPYPSFDPEWLANAKAEAEDNVRRTGNHPSIAVYSGNNEVIDRIADKTTDWNISREEYELLFRRTLRDVVRQYAPNTPYTPGSPEIGDHHYWDVWHGSATFDSYRNLRGFMSEYGFQAFDVPRTVEEFTPPEDRRSVESASMLQHEKNWRDGDALIVSTALRYFRKPKDFDSTLWIGQINQAAGIVEGVEHWRRDWPNSTASLVWQYNDPWPGTSWSMIDYYGRPKALYYQLKHAYAPVALSGLADAKTGSVQLWIANDRTQPKSGRLSWTLSRIDGTVIDKGSKSVSVPAGTSSAEVLTMNLKPAIDNLGAANLLFWSSLDVVGEPESSTLLTFARTKELNLVDPSITSTVSKTANGYRVTLESKRPALWSWIELKGMDADLSDNFIHLQPGKKATIDLTSTGNASIESIQKALIVRSLFDTYAPGTAAYPTVHPATDGTIVANADEADIEGNEPVLEVGTPSNLGNWRSVDGAIKWFVEGAKSGTYDVKVQISAPPTDAGGKYEIDVEGTKLTGTVPATKNWTDYVNIDLGKVTIAKDGKVTIFLRAIDKPHDNLMNLRSVTLTPVP